MRTKYLEECCASMLIGIVIMAIIFAFTHRIFDGVMETATFLVATWFIAVYVVWTVIAVVDERRK